MCNLLIIPRFPSNAF